LPDNIKPGVSAKAEVIITNIENALSVPIQAVTTLKGRQVVYLANGRNPTPKPVEVGMYNTKYIQIVSGLNEGDRVLLAPPLDIQEKDLEGEVLAPDEKAKVKVTNAVPASPRGGMPRGIETTSLPRPGTNGPSFGTRPNGVPGNAERPAGGAEGRAPETAQALGQGPGQGQPGAPGQGQGQGRPRFDREAMMKRFDADGDGVLSETERAAMRQAFGGGAGGGGGRGERGERGERQGAEAGAAGGGSGGEGGGRRARSNGPEVGQPRSE
jgi:hypothetical protein